MLIDLTQTLTPGIPDWDGTCGFEMETLAKITTDNILLHKIHSINGIGTHMDAPAHFCADATFIADLPLQNFIGPAVVINLSELCTANYCISTDDIKQFENANGAIPEDSLILVHTGWSQHWHNPKMYRSEDVDGTRHFPSLSIESIDYLLSKNIKGIGVDTLSPETGNNGFPAHKKILGADKFIIENLCNLEKLPPYGATVFALPLKIAGAGEAPCRVIAQLQ